MRADYHIHTIHCGHAQGSVTDYVRAALQLQLDTICFADHLYRYYVPPEQRTNGWDWTMPEQALDLYVQDVLKAREKFPEIDVRLGIEVDYAEGHETTLEKILTAYPFDYVLASVHYLPQLGDRHITEYHMEEPHQVYEWFYEALTKAARTGLFSCLAHPDFVWRYFRYEWPKHQNIQAKIDAMIQAVAHQGNMSIEANSNSVLWMSGKTPEEQEYFPAFFSKVVAQKVPIAFGSDAHRPLQVCAGFGEMIEILKGLGVKKMAVFQNRKLKIVKIT